MSSPHMVGSSAGAAIQICATVYALETAAASSNCLKWTCALACQQRLAAGAEASCAHIHKEELPYTPRSAHGA